MTGMFTLFLVVCCTAILAFFSQEFAGLIKKLFAIKGMKLILPLFLASYSVYSFDFLVLDLLFYIKDKLSALMLFLNDFLAYGFYGKKIVLIAALFITTVVPVAILNFFSYRNTNKPYSHPYLVSTLIWIICVFLLMPPGS